MVKCTFAKEGDNCFGKEFKNQAMLNTHVKFKHSSPPKIENKKPEEEPPAEEFIDELSHSDIGLDQSAAPPPGESNPDAVSQQKKAFYCSNCGFDQLKGDEENCPNCKDKFEK